MNSHLHANVRRSLGQLTLISFGAAVLFAGLFQATKIEPISRISLFAEDPYDAVASIAFQIALAAGLISLIRWRRLS